MDIAEIIGFLQSDEMNMPMDKSAHPNKKKPKTVLMQVINEIFPKMHSTKGIVNIVTQEKKRTVTVDKYFPSTMFFVFIGSEKRISL